MWSVRNWLCQSRKKFSVKWYFDPHGEFEIKTLASGGIREGQWALWQRFWCFFNIADWYKRHIFLVFFSSLLRYFGYIFLKKGREDGGILSKGRWANLLNLEGSKSSKQWNEKSSGFKYSNLSPSSTMTLGRSFPIFGINSSSEKVRKWTTNQWSFMSLSSTTLMKFINTRFPTGHSGAIWILSGLNLISSLSFHLRKVYCNAWQGEWLFSQNPWYDPIDLENKSTNHFQISLLLKIIIT